MPQKTLEQTLYLKSREFLGFKNLKPGEPFTRKVRFQDGTTAEFQITRIEQKPSEFMESVTWCDPYSGNTTTDSENSHAYNWTHRNQVNNTAYVLKIEVLSSTNDNLPDGFRTEKVQTNMEKRFYVRDNDGKDFLRYQSPDERNPKPVVFKDEIDAMLYITATCDNPNQWSVTRHIPQHPVSTGWLIHVLAVKFK